MQGTEGTELMQGVDGSAPTDEERLTTVGLLFESAMGLRMALQRRLDSERSLANQSFDVLIRLARSPGSELRMSELAAQTSLTPSGLTRSVDRLVEQELVIRRVCPEDRRGAFAVLTPAGRELMDRVVPEHVAHIDELLGNVYTPEEEQTLSLLLRKLRDHLFADKSEWNLACDGATGECLGDC